MALQKSRSRINVKGGGDLRLRELDPTPADPFLVVGYLSETALNDEHNFIEAMDELGEVADALSGSQSVMFTPLLKQSSLDEINLLKNADGKLYEVYYSVALKSGNVQEYHFPFCRIKPGVVATFQSATERTIPCEIHALSPAAAFTHTPTDFNVVKGVPYTVIENAAAQGPPTETAANVAASAAAAL